jgi:hypothetical protein
VGLAGTPPNFSPNFFMYIEPRGKSLIIRWKVDCKAYHISLKDHNNDICYPLAESLLNRIQSDIRANNFDTTLARYCTRKAKKAAALKSITASELLDRYAEYRNELSHNSKKGRPDWPQCKDLDEYIFTSDPEKVCVCRFLGRWRKVHSKEKSYFYKELDNFLKMR